MTHDPLCDYAHVAGGCESCDLIARVREAEFKRITQHDRHSGLACWTNWQAGYAKGRADALAEARDAVAALTPFVFAYQTWVSGDYGYDEGPWVKKENALAAIDALRGETE